VPRLARGDLTSAQYVNETARKVDSLRPQD
jgi:hypothetical protein